MLLLEYQAKDLLRRAQLPIPQGIVIHSPEELNPDDATFPIVIKSQVPVGGRGKAGGIKIAQAVDDFSHSYNEMWSRAIKGHMPSALLLEQALEIEREMYLSLRINRDKRRIEWLVSPNGGIDIEDNPASVKIIPQTKDSAYETISSSLNLDMSVIKPLLQRLEECFINNDLLLLEINPLVNTKAGDIVFADAKMVVDDNALFRHSEYANQAASSGVMPLGGTIGVIANGAGMAMSTMDTIYTAGGRPANFLDIGGGTGEEVFIRNLREITSLPGVTSIIINIFAGITRCDDIARGIIAAKQEISDLVPLYIRLEGTNRDEAAKLLDGAGIEILPDLKTCVERALATDGLPQDNTRPNLSSRQKNNLKALGKSESDDGKLATGELKQSSEATIDIERLFTSHPVIIQGITGHHGSFHARGMRDAGTNIVAGVTPGKGGETVDGIPVYNTVAEATSAHKARVSVIFVPARFAKSAMREALEAGITLVVCITEGIPVHDMLEVKMLADEKNATIIGPNCPGMIVPNSHKLGIIAAHITSPGTTAIISRSGTLTYELAHALTRKGIGQAIILGIGGDPVQGMNFTEALEICQQHSLINRIVMVGEIGGQSEQLAADYTANHVSKPIYGLVVGHSLPAGQQFGHAGAIVGSLGESAAEKTAYLTKRGVHTSSTLDELISSMIE